MKGEKSFSKEVYGIIINLISEKVKASTDKQKGIRAKIRKLGFYASDFGFAGGFTAKDFIGVASIKNGQPLNKAIVQATISLSKKTEILSARKKDSDENYVLDICDEVLGLKGIRQHRFDFLIGDAGTKLPVDMYYESLSLVIEYRERQHTEAVAHFDKPDVMTVSGVSRGEQRKIYDQRRRDVLPKHGIQLIEISYSDFDYDRRKKIKRDKRNDLVTIKKLLGTYGK